MSHSIDEHYEVYDETSRRAAKEHVCAACSEPIAKGARYTDVRIVWDGEARTLRRCERCQAIHVHLREVGEGDTWPAEKLDCGEEYREHWGKEPPESIAALAFWRPGDPLPESERGRSTKTEVRNGDEKKRRCGMVTKTQRLLGTEAEFIRQMEVPWRGGAVLVDCWSLMIDSERASVLLGDVDEYQRYPLHQHVRFLADQMGSDAWNPATSPPLWISQEEGKLIDGQHRMLAIKKSGRAFVFEVRVAPRDFVLTIDAGRKRRIADQIAMLGQRRLPSTVVVAIVASACDFSVERRHALLPSDHVALVERCPHTHLLLDLWKGKKIGGIGAGILGAAVRCADVDPVDAGAFFGAVVRNDGYIFQEYSSQANVISTWCMSHERRRSSADDIREAAVRSLNAWNHWRGRVPITHTKYSSTSPIPVAR